MQPSRAVDHYYQELRTGDWVQCLITGRRHLITHVGDMNVRSHDNGMMWAHNTVLFIGPLFEGWRP